MQTSKVQEAHVEMSCQIESHVDSVDLCDPNLPFDPFTIPQINSSELEIFMSLRGEKCPWDRADFVSLGLKFLFPSVYWVPRKKHLHPELQGELRPELFRWLTQVTFSPCIYRHSLARIWKDLNHLAPCPPGHQYYHQHAPLPPPPTPPRPSTAGC